MTALIEAGLLRVSFSNGRNSNRYPLTQPQPNPVSSNGVTSNQVHFYDRDSGRYQRLPCPDRLMTAGAGWRPSFSPDGSRLDWVDIVADDALSLDNPLLSGPYLERP